MNNPSKVYLHLGSNVGDCKKNLQIAIEQINKRVGNVQKTSSLYETAAWGKQDQDDFLNQAILVKTNLKPQDVLKTILSIEEDMGRTRTEKWSPRIIDIDILFYNNLIIKEKDLTIPHEHFHKRNFMLVPMMEIDGDYIHPVLNQSIDELYWQSPDDLEVIML